MLYMPRPGQSDSLLLRYYTQRRPRFRSDNNRQPPALARIPLLYHCDSDVGPGRGGRRVAAIVKIPIATMVLSISFSYLILLVEPDNLEFTWLFNPISPI